MRLSFFDKLDPLLDLETAFQLRRNLSYNHVQKLKNLTNPDLSFRTWDQVYSSLKTFIVHKGSFRSDQETHQNTRNEDC